MDNDTLNRIITGIVFLNIDGTIYKLSQPTKEQKALAGLVYRDTFDDCKFDGLITRDEATASLYKRRIWSTDSETRYKQSSEHLDGLKMDLYRASFSETKQKPIRRQIKNLKKSLEKSLGIKYSLDHITLESHAERTRDEFLIAICISQGNTPVYNFENYHKSDNYILQRFLNYLLTNIITAEEFRKMARTEPFRSLWVTGKEGLFGIPISNLSQDQRSLVMYSRMYDNVYENPERPTDKVVKDDDMLDGWFTIQRKGSDKDINKREVDKLLGVKKSDKFDNGRGGDMFIPTETAEEAKEIRALNDLNTRMKLKQRDNALAQKGRLEEHELPDVQLDLQNEARRQVAARGKG